MKKFSKFIKYITLGLSICEIFLSVNHFSRFEANDSVKNSEDENIIEMIPDETEKYDDLGKLIISEQRKKEVIELLLEARSKVPLRQNTHPHFIWLFKRFRLQPITFVGDGNKKELYLVAYRKNRRSDAETVAVEEDPQYCAIISQLSDTIFIINALYDSPKFWECKNLSKLHYLPGKENLRYFEEQYDGYIANFIFYLMEYNNGGTLEDYLDICCKDRKIPLNECAVAVQNYALAVKAFYECNLAYLSTHFNNIMCSIDESKQELTWRLVDYNNMLRFDEIEARFNISAKKNTADTVGRLLYKLIYGECDDAVFNDPKNIPFPKVEKISEVEKSAQDLIKKCFLPEKDGGFFGYSEVLKHPFLNAELHLKQMA